jgi:hypothetical protein
MPTYFQTLEQAEKHIQEKKSIGHSRINWCIVDCTIGFLVISEAQAAQCFPGLMQGCHEHLTKINYGF